MFWVSFLGKKIEELVTSEPLGCSMTYLRSSSLKLKFASCPEFWCRRKVPPASCFYRNSWWLHWNAYFCMKSFRKIPDDYYENTACCKDKIKGDQSENGKASSVEGAASVGVCWVQRGSQTADCACFGFVMNVWDVLWLCVAWFQWTLGILLIFIFSYVTLGFNLNALDVYAKSGFADSQVKTMWAPLDLCFQC